MKKILLLMCLVFFLISCNHEEEKISEPEITEIGVWDDELSTWDNVIFTK